MPTATEERPAEAPEKKPGVCHVAAQGTTFPGEPSLCGKPLDCMKPPVEGDARRCSCGRDACPDCLRAFSASFDG